MEKKKYWQTVGELNDTEGHKKLSADEFREDLPFEEADGKGLMDLKSPRRDFLKYLGFSTAAVTLAASCEIPVRKTIPYLNKPEDIIPGVANYYATTFIDGGDAIPAIAKVRDGRPIKIEGNELSSITQGGTTARMQASVLGLYDTSRLRFPMADGKEVSTFNAMDKMVASAMGSAGGSVVLLSSTINSPSTKQIITDFLAKYPGSRHIQYDEVSASGILQANEATYGKRVIPSYQFQNAKVIVSLGADFLGTWLNTVEYARQYGKGRSVNPENPEMSKHIHFESMLSLTGANADDRFIHRPSESGAVALNLLAKLGGSVTAPALSDDKLKKGVDMAAAMLTANKGQALVVSGSNDVNAQIVVNAINEAIGANGKTIDWSSPLQIRQGVDADLAQLIQDMKDGKVGTLMISRANPAYSHPLAEQFKAALKNVKVSISFSERLDETTELCKFVIPQHHFLESWGDAEPKLGYYSLLQPTIAPIFKTRYFQTNLLKWGGLESDYDSYFKKYWLNKLGGQENFDKALQDGVIEPSAATEVAVAFNGASLADAASKVAAAKKGGKAEVVLYQKVSTGDGAMLNNPWLLEMPDPITKATWDNYAVISYKMAEELGIKLDDTYEVEPEKPVIKVKVGNKELTLPILAVPGMQPNTIAIALGFGHNDNFGRASKGVGQNAYPFASYNGVNVDYSAIDASYEKTATVFRVAYTQSHGQYEGRDQVVKEFTMADYKKSREKVAEEREEMAKDFAKNTGDFRDEATLYHMEEHPQPGPKWGMSIDLNSCIGCGACTIACTAENNVSVVGKKEIMRAHEMHWLRIDRYFATYKNKTEGDDLNVVFMPMLCQHCDNAPCENVCPVYATNHSSEGLNQMTYNRCIGTRYCANNCPYKVRRFNWADYTGADSFPNNQQPLVDEGKMADVVMLMNDDLTRMVLNPDVTVRSRGVIEKCSFCVQRLQEAKLNAKKAQDPSLIRDVKTACSQACPTNAIVFGNVHDKESRIFKLRNEEQKNRLYYALDQLHVLPNVNYLVKIRNTDRPVGLQEVHEG